MAIKAYVRCSTNETRQDLDRQVKEIRDAVGKDAHIDFYKEFEHGDAAVKKELNKLFADIQSGDTIIVTEVSRLSRSTKQLCSLIDTVREKRLCLRIIGSVTIDCRNGEIDPMTKAFLQMAGVFAELELSMTSARIKSGLANRRAKGQTLGRPVLTMDTLPDVFFKHLPLFREKKISKTEFARLVDVSRPTLDKYIGIVDVATGK